MNKIATAGLCWLISLVVAKDVCSANPPKAEQPRPQWIWSSAPPQKAGADGVFSMSGISPEFKLPEDITRVELVVSFEYSAATVSLNHKSVFNLSPFSGPQKVDVTAMCLAGKLNRLVFIASGVGRDKPAAAMVQLTWRTSNGKSGSVVSGADWKFLDLQDGRAGRVVTLGEVGPHPWLRLNSKKQLAIGHSHDYTQWKRAIGQGAATDAARLEVPAGFRVTTVRSARADEDSWVAMTFDSQGRAIVAQEKQGLLRFTLKDGVVAKSERINASLRECRGLVFVGKDLYAMANNDKALFLLRDTTGDDQFDSIEKLVGFTGGVGHGRNQITIGPDGKLYAIFGDSVDEPKDVRKLPPSLASPNDIETTPSGFVARMDLKTRKWEVVVRGLRNPFGIAFNSHGDMFTYDADAEHDMGAPWYRPTRVLHLVPGGDYGWRRVTGRWPPYFPDRPDMPHPTIDIGKGSPTGVTFGTGSKFPPPYDSALFVLDWSYGRIIAVHLQPWGSSYSAGAEVFLRGQPLNVTDIAVGPDGAMYFTTGGRGTQSAMYRVEYVGPKVKPSKPTVQQTARKAFAAKSRKVRRDLEAMLKPIGSEAVNQAWSHLDNFDDPWIRHTARAVVEHQPLDAWRKLTFKKLGSEAWMALARVGTRDDLARLMREFSLELTSTGNVNDLSNEARTFMYQRFLDAKLPDADEFVRRKSAWRYQVLVEEKKSDNHPIVPTETALLESRVQFADAVPASMKMLEQETDDTNRMFWLFVLRNRPAGWTNELRTRYFRHLQSLSDMEGDAGMPTFVRLIREDAIKSVPDDQRAKYAALIKPDSAEPWRKQIADAKPRTQIRQWKVADLDKDIGGLAERDTDSGRRIFIEAKCVVCHRAERIGGVSGPDLTSVSRRFAPRDLLVSMLEPSRVVSEKYRNTTFVLSTGKTVTGRVMLGDFRSPDVRVTTDLLKPSEHVAFKKSDVESLRSSDISPMPKGLLDNFTSDEILDLLAYLSGR